MQSARCQWVVGADGMGRNQSTRDSAARTQLKSRCRHRCKLRTATGHTTQIIPPNPHAPNKHQRKRHRKDPRRAYATRLLCRARFIISPAAAALL